MEEELHLTISRVGISRSSSNQKKRLRFNLSWARKVECLLSNKRANFETMNHHARRKRKDSTDTTKQLNRIFERDLGICQLCKQVCRREDASREHVKPFNDCTVEEARSDTMMVLAHTWCNNKAA